jgi:hypothetical protein
LAPLGALGGFGPGKKFSKKTIDKIKNFCYNLITKEKERGNKKNDD